MLKAHKQFGVFGFVADGKCDRKLQLFHGLQYYGFNFNNRSPTEQNFTNWTTLTENNCILIRIIV